MRNGLNRGATCPEAGSRQVAPRAWRRGLGVLALAGLGLGAVSVTSDEDLTPTRPGITLSMAVDEGSPVPLALVTEQAAAKLYDRGVRGQGVDVALIDSGVAPVPGLDQPGKVRFGPDLSSEGDQPNLANLDTFGHGTHLAGIILGDDGHLVGGVAPESRLVSVKVAGAGGETDIAQVIAAIDWVIEHRNDDGLDIRVLNLSLGAPGVKTNAGDPLSAAVERAWDAGIVVVVAVGNRGNDAPGVDSPAVSPFPIAVGGTESFESSGLHDTVAAWSSAGNEYRAPDVVAPGRSILSLRVPGSTLDRLNPTAVVKERYFRGSGTSQAAAVVSGFTALLLSADPTLTPDQVKFLLEQPAFDIAPGEYLDGSGRIDVAHSAGILGSKKKAPIQQYPRALSDDAPVSYEIEKTDGFFALSDSSELDGSTTTYSDTTVLTTSTIDAEPIDATGYLVAPRDAAWSGGGWRGDVWSGGVWSGAAWQGTPWSGASWSGGVWSGVSVPDENATGDFSDATWSGLTWSGVTWSGLTWSGLTWSGLTWSGGIWS